MRKGYLNEIRSEEALIRPQNLASKFGVESVRLRVRGIRSGPCLFVDSIQVSKGSVR